MPQQLIRAAGRKREVVFTKTKNHYLHKAKQTAE